MVHLGGSTDNRLLSTLAQSGHELYNDALQATQDPRLQSELPESVVTNNWGTYCKTVSMLLACKSQYHQSVVHRLQHEYGIEIAYLRECLSRFQTLQKFIKSLSGNDNVIEYEKREVNYLLPIIQDRFHEADQDNYKIYQYTIPPTIPDIPRKQLAKTSTSLPDYMIQPKFSLFINVQ